VVGIASRYDPALTPDLDGVWPWRRLAQALEQENEGPRSCGSCRCGFIQGATVTDALSAPASANTPRPSTPGRGPTAVNRCP